jgi:flagellar protein FliO/FliZ
MVELVVRLVFSLAVILGMLMLLARFSAKKFRGNADALVRVVHRQALSRTSAVSVVVVGGRTLVLGTTEHQVQLITELDPEEVELTIAPPATVRSMESVHSPETPDSPLELVKPLGYTPRHAASESKARSSRVVGPAQGPLAGSVLSTQTWKQAFAAATSRVRDAS